MNLIKNLFNKQKIKVDEEELTWKRDKNANDQPFYPNQKHANERMSNDNRINNPPDNQGDDFDFYMPDQNKVSAINQPTWMTPSNKITNSEPPSKYVDYGMPTGSNPAFKKSSRRVMTEPAEFESSPNLINKHTNYADENPQNVLSVPNFGQLNDSGRIAGNSQGLTRDQDFRRNHRGNSTFRRKDRLDNPRLKEYYELENRINRLMLINNQDSDQKANTKQINIFDKDSGQFEENNYYADQNQYNHPQVYSQPKTDIFGEVKAQPNLTKRRLKIFEGQSNASNIDSNPSGVSNRSEPPVNQRNNNNLPKKVVTSAIFDDTTYEGKDFDELNKIYQERSTELRTLEDRHISMHSDPRNITHLEQLAKETSTKLSDLKPKTMYFDGEKRLLIEDINKKQVLLQNADRQNDQISSMSTADLNAKETIIREIEKIQIKIEKQKSDIDKFQISGEEKHKKWKNLSEKNMTYELETMKMNLNNYDEELIQELNYFLKKYK
jgi:hypothetical protein